MASAWCACPRVRSADVPAIYVQPVSAALLGLGLPGVTIRKGEPQGRTRRAQNELAHHEHTRGSPVEPPCALFGGQARCSGTSSLSTSWGSLATARRSADHSAGSSRG